MSGFNTTHNDGKRPRDDGEYRIALFGPQVTNWTREDLSDLHFLLQDRQFAFLKKTLLELPLLGPILNQLDDTYGSTALKKLTVLSELTTGKGDIDPEGLSNAQLAPLTVINQVVDFIRSTDLPATDHSLTSAVGCAQGFCIGFLSAAALSSAAGWAEFETNVSNAIRLAACIGSIVDSYEASLSPYDRSTAISVRCRTAAHRTFLDSCLDLFPKAYTSCITDEQTLTVTVPEGSRASFCARLSEGELPFAIIGLHGSYHHRVHANAAERLSEICKENLGLLGLSTAANSKLLFPLRSTAANNELIDTGALHNTALQIILCKRAHWFQTVKLAVKDAPDDKTAKFVSVGKGSCVPRSLSHGQPHDGDDPNVANRKLNKEIAVIGMACRFPQAEDLDAFWKLIVEGGTAVGKMPLERFNVAQLARGSQAAEVWGNFLDQPDVFDHRFFSISGREAKSMDPQQRLALQVAYEALESSGYHARSSGSENKDIGCYLGVGAVDYEENIASENPNAFSAVGTLRAFISGRISHFFGWSGPSITFDSACSSSAVAIHTACKAIIGGECSMALTGGVNVITSPNLHQNLAAASFLNPSGPSRAFDAAAAGYCRGEGAGIIVLKRLSRALAEGDTILGVIAASAINQNSNSSSITVPDSQSQSLLYRRVLSDARITPQEVSYVEAHGTGTQVGDPVEYESIRLALTEEESKSSQRDSSRIFVGSVKDSIGHTEAASGAAGVIKTLLMMQHNTIPKQAGFVSLNPQIKAVERIVVPKTSHPWTGPRSKSPGRVALVNNYGASGSNAVLLLRSHETETEETNKQESKPAVYPVVLSAKTPNSLKVSIDALRSKLVRFDASLFGSVAYGLSRSQNSSLDYRLAFTAADRDDAVSILDAWKDGTTTDRTTKLPVIMCFGGQTGRNVRVSRELYDGCHLFRDHLDECNAICLSLGLPSIFPYIFQDDEIQDLVSLHCMLLSLQISSARTWIDGGLGTHGLTLIGHSFGQLAALCVAESISLVDTFRLVAGRARLIRDSWGPESGGMLFVECALSELEGIVTAVNSSKAVTGRDDSAGCGVDVSCYNGPRSFVIAGDALSLDMAKEECRTRGIPTRWLQSTHAYHSRLTDSILQSLVALAATISVRPPRRGVRVETCSAKGSWDDLQYTAEEVAQHTRQPVYFGDAVDRIATRLPSGAVWLEAGSLSPVVAMARRAVSSKSPRSDVFIPMNLTSEDAYPSLGKATSQLWTAGSKAQYWPFQSGQHRRPPYQIVSLPPYQFEKTSHWIQYKPRNQLMDKTEKLTPNDAASGLVALVKSSTNSGELLFSVNTSNAVFQFAARGHAVAGQSLCPASIYIELAASAARIVLDPVSTQAMEAELGTVLLPHVEGLTMSAPLGVAMSVNGTHVFLRLCQTEGQAVQDKTWDFSIFSRSSTSGFGPGLIIDGDQRGTEHAKGRVRLTIAPSVADDVRPDKRLKLLQRLGVQGTRRLLKAAKPRTDQGISGSMVYKLFSDVVEYAEYFQGVQSVRACDDEAVGLVAVPRVPFPVPSSQGICDPIILDNFLQVSGIHVNCFSSQPAENDQVFVCTAVEEVIFTASFLKERSESQTWSVYTRYEPPSSSPKGDMSNDIIVCDKNSGDLVLAILGATFKSVTFKSLARSLTRLNKVPIETKTATTTPARTSVPTPASSNTSDDAFENEDVNIDEAENLAADPDSHPGALLVVRKLLGSILEIPVEDIESATTLDDLGVDSLLVTEILSEVQSKFGLSIEPATFLSCTDVLSVARLIEVDQSGVARPSAKKTLGRIRVQDNRSSRSTISTSTIDSAVDLTYKTEQANLSNLNLAILARESFLAAKPDYDSHAKTAGFETFYADVFPMQSELVVRYVVDAFARQGCNLEALESGNVVSTIAYDTKHKKLIPQLYRLLEDAQVIIKGDDGLYRRSDTAKHPISTLSAATLHNQMLAKFPKHASETKLLNSTGSRLAECLSGAVDPVGVLFQSSAARALLEDVYTNAPIFKTGTLLLGQYLASVLERFAASSGGSQDPGRRELRILELGAGTGGTTKHIIETLLNVSHEDINLSYTFTDLSSSLVAAAKRKFAKWPFVQYAVMDIEKEPSAQFLGSYDIILSTNCIHATRNLVKSTTNIRKLLRPDGLLCLVELTRNLYWFDLVFGLLEGWWLFNDGREHALAHEQRWNTDLRDAGFRWIDWSSTRTLESQALRVITASPYELEPLQGSDEETRSSDTSKTAETEQDLPIKQTLPFKEVDGLQLEADIYYPSEKVNPGKKLPIALMIHGGGHIMLSRNDIRPEQTDMLLRNGFVAISVDYRLCPEVALLDGPMTDVVDALAWIRTVLPRITLSRQDVVVDVDKVVTIGWSTGGHLAMTLAWTSFQKNIQPPAAILAFYCPTDYEDLFWTTPNVPAGADDASSSENSTREDPDHDSTWTDALFPAPATSYSIPSRKRALGGWLAPSDARSRLAVHMNVHGRALNVLLGPRREQASKTSWRKTMPTSPAAADVVAASPLAQIQRGRYATPTFLVHPRQDDLIPWQQAERTWRALQAEGVDAELRILEHVPHLFDIYPQHRADEAAQQAVTDGYEFLAKHVGVEWMG